MPGIELGLRNQHFNAGPSIEYLRYFYRAALGSLNVDRFETRPVCPHEPQFSCLHASAVSGGSEQSVDC